MKIYILLLLLLIFVNFFCIVFDCSNLYKFYDCNHFTLCASLKSFTYLKSFQSLTDWESFSLFGSWIWRSVQRVWAVIGAAVAIADVVFYR